jgi:hypothetical protein
MAPQILQVYVLDFNLVNHAVIFSENQLEFHSCEWTPWFFCQELSQVTLPERVGFFQVASSQSANRKLGLKDLNVTRKPYT